MGGITIGFDVEGGAFVTSQFEKALCMNADEKKVAEHFIAVIRAAKPDAPLALEQRSANYISLCSGVNDFLRFKYTDRTRWVSLDVEWLDVAEDDSRFAAQKNKNQRHWKSKITDMSDLAALDELAVRACRYIEAY